MREVVFLQAELSLVNPHTLPVERSIKLASG